MYSFAEWQRMDEQLRAKELAVAECATKLARGACTQDELNALQAEVTRMRALADAVFASTFGAARRQAPAARMY